MSVYQYALIYDCLCASVDTHVTEIKAPISCTEPCLFSSPFTLFKHVATLLGILYLVLWLSWQTFHGADTSSF